MIQSNTLLAPFLTVKQTDILHINCENKNYMRLPSYIPISMLFCFCTANFTITLQPKEQHFFVLFLFLIWYHLLFFFLLNQQECNINVTVFILETLYSFPSKNANGPSSTERRPTAETENPFWALNEVSRAQGKPITNCTFHILGSGGCERGEEENP